MWARVIDQQGAHHLSGETEKVGARPAIEGRASGGDPLWVTSAALPLA